jgi:hypothetical protein
VSFCIEKHEVFLEYGGRLHPLHRHVTIMTLSASPAKPARVAVVGGRRALRAGCLLAGLRRESVVARPSPLPALRASLLPILLPPKHALY